MRWRSNRDTVAEYVLRQTRIRRGLWIFKFACGNRPGLNIEPGIQQDRICVLDHLLLELPAIVHGAAQHHGDVGVAVGLAVALARLPNRIRRIYLRPNLARNSASS